MAVWTADANLPSTSIEEEGYQRRGNELNLEMLTLALRSIVSGRRSWTKGGQARVRLIEGYRTIELPGEIDASILAPIRDAMNQV